MRVREAQRQDVPVLVEVLAQVAQGGMLGLEHPIDHAAVRERLCSLLEEEVSAVLVLEDEGRVIGEGSVRQSSPGVLRLSMAILPAGRRRGGGRMLIERLAAYGQSVGAHKLELEVWLDNTPAITLYGSTGFQIEGLRHRHYRSRDGRLRSTLIMARRLDLSEC